MVVAAGVADGVGTAGLTGGAAIGGGGPVRMGEEIRAGLVDALAAKETPASAPPTMAKSAATATFALALVIAHSF